LIANDIVSNRVRLTGAEFRFLRKELRLSQESVASILGNEAQTVSLWERGTSDVPSWADRILRTLYIETMTGDAGLKQLVDRINSLERDAHEHRQLRLELEDTSDGWALAA
jgi:transcriptional regulator with XRE-family HTH domain